MEDYNFDSYSHLSINTKCWLLFVYVSDGEKLNGYEEATKAMVRLTHSMIKIPRSLALAEN